MKFRRTSERCASTLLPEQRSLLEETLDTDIYELDGELQRHRKKADKRGEDEKKVPKRAQLPPPPAASLRASRTGRHYLRLRQGHTAHRRGRVR